MALTWRPLASGPGWRVGDIRCTAGPQDRIFEERHESFCIAAVTEGSFQYRAMTGAAMLVPGAVLLGNHGHGFECGHEHGTGDRCLAFHFTPAQLETVVAAVPGARRVAFTAPNLPPLLPLLPLLAAAEAARDDEADEAAWEELALRLAGAVASLLNDGPRAASQLGPRDQARITAALRRIEREAETGLTLTELAGGAAMSPYHFLRRFRALVGMTPHQFLLRTRLHRVAVELRCSDKAVSAIAFDAGFNDLATFNRRFRRVAGMSPGQYRARSGRR